MSGDAPPPTSSSSAADWRAARRRGPSPQRGATDVIIVERDTVGSGGTGKSSGVVRCHYGVPSLAAMATRALDVFENAVEILGDDIGFHQTGYVVGVGPENVDAMHASLAGQRAVGVRTEDIDAAEVQKLWPVADLEPFGAFAWEQRGGYGDAYQTAQAFAAAARRAGARLRQGTTVAEILVDRGRATGVRLADGSTISRARLCSPPGRGRCRCSPRTGSTCPSPCTASRSCSSTPGSTSGRSRCSPISCRCSTSGPRAAGRSSSATPISPCSSPPIPTTTRTGRPRRSSTSPSRRSGPGSPVSATASIASTYAGCYDVTPDFNPVISATPIESLIVAAGFSGHGFKISPSVGALVADLVLDGHSNLPHVPESDFRLSRFAEGAPLRSPHPYVGAGEMR